ncbi:hypothetical protein EMIHUDRAFT_118166 [Emiliania huxleyi CCMP1516]|uniref:Choloylglycine hydrolase/NAAA C-terminal domain-containing protein n=2 Tax=Emiliania huxleyi TaxID=2903 RepID=A0A0D3J6H3_EMIH1|nr:hypothetical protein EMIHUDRAFT_118166 [Emiliania huxleyi CCMP1516]EOD19108.1 hypothetical protein EMIHUDRAFT_118166 [Emiliania huxleyi CCMP1516]|eukprot:XP_005771537.1 hypothetical protein EMIHUDRAFT_118166 [Emiliania huxleyi CCMP1516]
MDGINEEGLTVTANLHHQAEYQTKTSPKTDSPNDIGHHQVAKHLLAQYKTVKEVIDYLKGVSVYHGFKPLPGFHWLVADSNGNAVTIEYIDGELKVYGNKDVGVLTNDPSFDWQLGYVDQFAGYSVKTTPEAPTKQSCGQFSKSISTAGGDDFTTCNAYTDDPETEQNVVVNAPKVASNGMSTRLLPGSYTPADRFVRTFLIKESVMQNAEDDGSLKPTTLDEALVVGTGLLNNVHIVRGSVGRERSLIPPPWEYTAWAALKVPKYKTKTGVVFKQEHGPYFYYRTYNNMQWNKIDLSQLKDFFTTGAAKIDPIPFPNIDDCRSGDGNKDPKWGCFDAGVKDTTPQWQCCSPGETANGSRTLLFAPGGGCHRC